MFVEEYTPLVFKLTFGLEIREREAFAELDFSRWMDF
jgi:hypothetical protein